MLKVAYGECTARQKSVYKWNNFFTEGREDALEGPARQQPMKRLKQ